jgi:transposase
MAEVFLRSLAQMRRIKPFFPLSRGVPRVISGIIFVIRNGLRRRAAPPAYGPVQDPLHPHLRRARGPGARD